MVLGYDGTDSEAPARRKETRPRHLVNSTRVYEAGKLHYGAAMLNEEGNMIGSMMILDYPTEADLRADWLDVEPYVLEGVWKEVVIRPVQPGGWFLEK